MENIIDNNGLEEMKAQMAILKNKIEGQTMLNERLMRRAMNDRMSLVRRMVVLDVVMVIVHCSYVCFHGAVRLVAAVLCGERCAV